MENLKEYMKEWNKKNADKVQQYRRKYRKKFPWANSYEHARDRCLNPKNEAYSHYGKRGIEFKMTRQDFKELWARDNASSMLSPTIDRIDNDGNYEFSNCRFIERARNTARNRGKRRGGIKRLQFDTVGNLLRVWNSAKEAADSLNCYATSIERACKREGSSHGFLWLNAGREK